MAGTIVGDTAVDDVVESILEESAWKEPPVDVLELARRMGVEVAIDTRQQGRGRHKRLRGRSAIFLRPDPRPERLQWAAAHEVGELVAHRLFSTMNCDPREIAPDAREQSANLLASRLLLPTRWFAADAEHMQADLLRLKSRYCTASHELIALRLLDFSPPAVVTLFDQGRVTRRRCNSSPMPPRLLPSEWDCWRCVHHSGQPVHCLEEGIRITGWPIHEAGWRREILRTTASPAEW